jgi:hypothetical protein
LTVVSKLFGQGIIYAREPAGGRGEAEPGSELARWLAEGSMEDGAVVDEASAPQQLVAEAERAGLRETSAGARPAATDDARTSGERQGSKTLKTFSLDPRILSLDTPPPGPGAPAAAADPEKPAFRRKPTGDTLRLPAALLDQDSAASPPARPPPLPPTGERAAEAASPIEVSAVVEHAWREPAELAVGLPRTPPGGVSSPSPAGTLSAADAAGPMDKPDTLKGFPIPDGLAEADQPGLARKSPASDDARPARTTIEFGPREVAPSASVRAGFAVEPAAEPAREMDWGAWGQGSESTPAAESEPLPDAVPGAVAGAEPAAPPPYSAEFGQGRAPISGEEPQIQQADHAPAMAEATLTSNSSTAGQPSKAMPTIGKLDGDLLPHERRWPLFAVAVVLLVAGGLFTLRIGPTGSRFFPSSRTESSVATAPKASVSSAIEADQGAVNRESPQPGDQMPGSSPTAEPVAAEKQVAAPADAGAKLAARQAPGGPPKVASGETPSRAPDAGQVGAPALAPATPGTAELRERCRKADAGGNGKPTAVLAACRPASEAEPEAADLMVIVARAELDRGRAVEARSWAKRATEVNPDLADAYVVLGGAEQEAENPDAAKAAYKKYLELAPNGRHARELRSILESL